MTATNNPIFTPMAQALAKSALKFAVGHAIFCPGCGNVMDCARAVSVDILKGEHLEGTKTCCASCYDMRVAPTIAGLVAKYDGLRMEVQDGRVLFARPKRARKMKAPAQVIEDTGLTVEQVLEREGVNPDDCAEYLEALVMGDENCPSLCAQGCQVETDAKCEHGHVSLLRAMGMV